MKARGPCLRYTVELESAAAARRGEAFFYAAAPLANPQGRLDLPFLVFRSSDKKLVARTPSRDAAEEIVIRRNATTVVRHVGLGIYVVESKS